MRFPLRLLCLVALITLERFGFAAPESEKTSDFAGEVEVLQAKLIKAPDDVDLRLKMASRLSWLKRYPEARIEAQKVIDAAPRYWDAHILIARIDAWEGEYADARQRLETILEAVPDHKEALTLSADIGLWSKNFDESAAAVERLIETKPTAALYYRLAQIAVERMDPLKARGYADKALALDPNHKQARILRDQVLFAKAYATSHMEFFSDIVGEERQAWGQKLAIAILPGSSLGVTLSYEFHHRFATNNHRFGGRLNLRASDKLVISTFLRGGFVEVLPKWSADIGLSYQLKPSINVSGRYSLDSMKWPGVLHRGTVSVSSQINDTTLLQAQYFGGVMRHCNEDGFVQGVTLLSRWKFKRIGFGAHYSFGTELERPPLPALLEGRLDDDFCLDELGQEVSGSPVDLAETRAHDMGGLASLTFGKTQLQAGYSIQLRFNDTEVHIFHLSLQKAF